MTAQATGARFEQLALEHLQRAGLKLVARNFRTRFGELDLILRDGAMLVFAEVRYRRDARFGGGAASVGPSKRAKLERAARGFLQAHSELACLPCRFDVIAFDGDADAPSCDWQRAAFETC
ncbi:MAG TPA: YraN family protein [Rhodanobacteraceae bacterium]|jgi:putative endonuclease|nr:YraN family protein [Rhodanobacteraceae bacterium]